MLHKSTGPAGRGYQLIYANYFAQIERADRVATLSRSSYCEARDNLSWEAFAYLLNKVSLEHNRQFKAPLWRSHRVRAVDGTCIQLPRSKELLAKFPLRHNWVGSTHWPYAYLVLAADIFTGQTTHTNLGNKYSSERDQLRTMLTTFSKGDISILDRGFEGRNVWQAFDDLGQHYIGRLRARGVVIKFNQKSRDQILELQTDKGKTIKVRILRGQKFRTGNYLFIATNLLDQKKYDRQSLLELYKKRQAVEEVFLHLKNTLHVKNIRSKKLNGVLQEIYAALTMTSLLAGIRHLFEQNIKAKKRINFKALCWRIETTFKILLTPQSARTTLRQFEGIFTFYHFKQPGRAYPRWSLQPPSKWITERSNKNFRAKIRGLRS